MSARGLLDIASSLLGRRVQHFQKTECQSGQAHSCAAAGKRQRVSPQDDAFHFFNRTDADKEGQRKPHLEEAAMALLLLDVHSAPGKVTSLDACSTRRLAETRALSRSAAAPLDMPAADLHGLRCLKAAGSDVIAAATARATALLRAVCMMAHVIYSSVS